MDFLIWLTAAIVAVIPLLIVIGNFTRWPREPRKLVPNCLLTKSPVVFVTGPRSPFYFRHYWNSLPLFLAAHGYDVRVLRLPWKDSAKRKLWAQRLLSAQAFHVVLDRWTAEEISELLRTLPTRSLFIPRASSRLPFQFRLIDSLHRWWIQKPSSPMAISLKELGFNSRGARSELLNFIRHEAEREWADAMSANSENPFEESSKP